MKNRPIRLEQDEVVIIDQRLLPHQYVEARLTCVDDIIKAIKEMYVRGAPLIGVTAAYGVYLAALTAPNGNEHEYLKNEASRIKLARPTAVNLAWAVDMMLSEILQETNKNDIVEKARTKAISISDFEVKNCKSIGEHGVKLIEEIRTKKPGKRVNILTHCNAGWLACVEYGTATAPMYVAFDKGIDIHVWVDETRPLNQGARLTAWELSQYKIPHTVIADNTGGHLMQHGLVDIVIVGSDRTTYTGDVANKIGTYLKALAAKDNNVPFYVALPSSTFDRTISDGISQIPIEERNPDEIRYIQGYHDNNIISVLVPPESSKCANYAFDVTPSRLVTGLITEKGICKANEQDIRKLLFEDK